MERCMLLKGIQKLLKINYIPKNFCMINLYRLKANGEEEQEQGNVNN